MVLLPACCILQPQRRLAEVIQRRFSIDDTFTSMVVCLRGPGIFPEPPLSLFFPLGIFFSKLYRPSWLLSIRMSSHELAHPLISPSPTSRALVWRPPPAGDKAAISSCPVTQTRRPPGTTGVSLIPIDFMRSVRFRSELLFPKAVHRLPLRRKLVGNGSPVARGPSKNIYSEDLVCVSIELL